MSILKSIKKRNMSDAKSNVLTIIFAFVLAIAAWFVVSMTLYPSVSKTIESIPLTLDLSGSTAAENGLSFIGSNVETVDISFDCSRTDYNLLNSETLSAYVDFDNVTTSGFKTLSIKVRSTNGASFSNLSVYPSNVTVELDKYDSIELPITARIPNVKFADGKVCDPDEITCEPATISVRGPAAQLAKISSCYALSEKSMTLDSSYSLPSDKIQLFSEDGKEIDQSLMTFDNTSFNIDIPVLTQKTVKLDIQLLGMPTDFDRNCLSYSLSPDTLTIATNNNQTDLPDTLEIIKIPLSDLKIGYSRSFDISSFLETRNIINMSGSDTVSVTLSGETNTGEKLASKDIILNSSNIHLLNAPSDNYDYNILSQKLTVTIVGPESVVADITANDLAAEANLLNADTTMDQFNYDAFISCLTHDNVWSVTSAKVTIQKTLKAGATTTAAATTATSSTRSR